MDDYFLYRSFDFDKAYRALFIFAMRFYDQMPKQAVLKDPLAHANAKPDMAVLQAFARHARGLGFGNDRINEFSNLTMDHVAIRTLQPGMSSDGPRIPEKRRSGGPHRCDYEYEQRLLTFELLNDGSEPEGKELTPLFVRRAIYQSFFGRTVDKDSATRPIRSSSVYTDDNQDNWSVSGSAIAIYNNTFDQHQPAPGQINRLSTIVEVADEDMEERLGSDDGGPLSSQAASMILEAYVKPQKKRASPKSRIVGRYDSWHGMIFCGIGKPGRSLKWTARNPQWFLQCARLFHYYDNGGDFVRPDAIQERNDGHNTESRIIVAQPKSHIEMDRSAFRNETMPSFREWINTMEGHVQNEDPLDDTQALLSINPRKHSLSGSSTTSRKVAKTTRNATPSRDVSRISGRLMVHRKPNSKGKRRATDNMRSFLDVKPLSTHRLYLPEGS